MKNNLRLCGVLLGLATLNASATQYVFVAEDASIETKLCVNAGSDNRPALRHDLGIYHRNIRYTANTVSCNGKSMAQFAHQYGAQSTYALLERFTYSKNKVRPTVTITDMAKVSGGDIVYISVSSK